MEGKPVHQVGVFLIPGEKEIPNHPGEPQRHQVAQSTRQCMEVYLYRSSLLTFFSQTKLILKVHLCVYNEYHLWAANSAALSPTYFLTSHRHTDKRDVRQPELDVGNALQGLVSCPGLWAVGKVLLWSVTKEEAGKEVGLGSFRTTELNDSWFYFDKVRTSPDEADFSSWVTVLMFTFLPDMELKLKHWKLL